MSDTLRRLRRLLPGFGIAAATLSGGCGSEITLPDATIPIASQLITLHALTGTPVTTPSAYNMLQLIEVRTDVTNDFDFIFDLGVDSTFGLGNSGDTIAVLIPRGYIGFLDDGGLQWTLTPFDSIVQAPTTGYEMKKPTRIRQGDAVLAASRIQSCTYGYSLPHYAKLDIQLIDLVERKAVIRVIIDPNCGYRSLKSGIPTQ